MESDRWLPSGAGRGHAGWRGGSQHAEAPPERTGGLRVALTLLSERAAAPDARWARTTFRPSTLGSWRTTCEPPAPVRACRPAVPPSVTPGALFFRVTTPAFLICLLDVRCQVPKRTPERAQLSIPREAASEKDSVRTRRAAVHALAPCSRRHAHMASHAVST